VGRGARRGGGGKGGAAGERVGGDSWWLAGREKGAYPKQQALREGQGSSLSNASVPCLHCSNVGAGRGPRPAHLHPRIEAGVLLGVDAARGDGIALLQQQQKVMRASSGVEL